VLCHRRFDGHRNEQKSTGLKGSRKLQGFSAATPATTINSILTNSNTIRSTVMPVPTAGTILAGNIVAMSDMTVSPGDATATANGIFASSNAIRNAVMPVAGVGTLIAGTATSNAAMTIGPGDATVTANGIIASSNAIIAPLGAP
jgi:uncharacterized Zn-binding protein involved in type VI secretion